jgi:hypothetical protein
MPPVRPRGGGRLFVGGQVRAQFVFDSIHFHDNFNFKGWLQGISLVYTRERM